MLDKVVARNIVPLHREFYRAATDHPYLFWQKFPINSKDNFGTKLHGEIKANFGTKYLRKNINLLK